MAKQKNIRRDIEKENAELRDSLQKEYQLQSNLVDILQKKVQGQRQLNDTQTSLIDEIKSQKSIDDQLVSIQKAKQKIIDKQAKTGKDVGKALLKRLNDTEQILRVEKAKNDNLSIQKQYQDGLKDSLKDALGLSNKYVEAFNAGGAAALGFLAMTKAVEYISSTIGSIVTDGYHLYKELGIGADEAFRLSTNAFTSLENFGSLLLYGEGFTSSAREAAEYYGRTAEITGDMQRNMATLKKLGVDSTKAVQLDKIFSDAAGDGNDLTDSIKVIAKKEGVTAKKLFEGMADDMSRLVGATEDEIKAMAKTNAQLIKRGMTMKQLEDISNNVLSVEQSMRAEAKARAFIGRDINANGVRQAALALQTATTDKERSAAMLDMSRILEEQVGSADDFNNMSIKQRQLFAESYGMSVDGITEMLTKQKQFNELQAKGMSDEEVLAEIERREAMDASITALKEMGSEAGNLSMAMIPALASAKELGLQNTMIGKGFSKATKGAGNLLKKLYEMTAGKLLGKLGGIGETLGGGGKGPKAPKGPKMPKSGGKAMSGMTGAIEKIDAKKLLAGGAALVLVAASVFIFAKAVQEFTSVSWKEVGMAVVSMVALVGALALVGTIMSSGVGAVAILAGAAAMIVIAGAMYVLGKAIQEIATGFGMLGELGTQLTELVSIAPGMLLLAYSFGVLGASMIPLAAGLALITPFIGTLAVLGTMLPLINNSLNGGSNSNDTTSETKTDTMGELLSEIKGLRQDLQAQPIMVNVDGKVVSRISRVQNRQSVSKNGYGG